MNFTAALVENVFGAFRVGELRLIRISDSPIPYGVYLEHGRNGGAFWWFFRLDAAASHLFVFFLVFFFSLLI